MEAHAGESVTDKSKSGRVDKRHACGSHVE